MSKSAPYQIPRQPGRSRAILLAIVMHLVLLAFLWIGIRWQNETPLAVEAEIWDPTVREAAPLPEPKQEPPKPAPQPTPEPQAPPPKVEEPPVVKPDIALEKEKQRKAQEKKREEQEKAAKLEREKEERLKKEKQEADARKKAQADKLAAEQHQKQQAAEVKAAEQRRQEDLKRLLNQASSSSGGTGNAAQSQGPRGNADYVSKLIVKIRSNTIFDVPANLSGNPTVEYTVELLPDGSVCGIRKGKSSNLPGFDEAVEQAIKKSQPFPADKNGKVPSGFTFTHKPKDQ